jgi:hypothetical protein
MCNFYESEEYEIFNSSNVENISLLFISFDWTSCFNFWSSLENESWFEREIWVGIIDWLWISDIVLISEIWYFWVKLLLNVCGGDVSELLFLSLKIWMIVFLS